MIPTIEVVAQDIKQTIAINHIVVVQDFDGGAIIITTNGKVHTLESYVSVLQKIKAVGDTEPIKPRSSGTF